MNGTLGGDGWRAFWDRGGWWKAVGAAAVYLALYLGTGWAVARAGGRIDPERLFATPRNVLLGLAVPVAAGSLVLLAFAGSLGWLRPLFARQPVAGRGWMWIAPAAVLVTVVLRLAGTGYGAYSPGVVALAFAAGAFIGFSEELLTRGIAVNLLRKGGYSEVAAALLSSLLFALLHTANAFAGFSRLVVLATVGFTFCFGMCMYLALRATGFLAAPMIVHALYDPATFLATGGIDVAHGGEPGRLLSLAGTSTLVFLACALAAPWFIRGRVGGGTDVAEPAGSS